MAGFCMRLVLALLAPLALASCLYEPGKFESALTLNADRSFTFSYKGEVIAVEPQSPAVSSDEDGKPAAPDPAEQASKEAEYRAVAEALRKEPGFASAEYKGNQVFAVDYRITSKLTHGFVFPLNIDARMVIPFVAIELRGNDRVRVIAPSFANDRSQSGGQLGEAMPMTRASRLDGSFTLTNLGVLNEWLNS